jgi:ubiquinone/menaquinone biosynthesis C-methylase UbiE
MVLPNPLQETEDTLQGAKLGGPAGYGTYAIAKRIGKIDEHFSLHGKRLLDLGCGNGSYTVELTRRAKWVCAMDVLEANLRQFREIIPRVQGCGENLPFAGESFDAITLIEVLEHTRSDAEVFRECFRVLRPGGALILFVPNKLYPLESHPCHCGGLALGHNIPFISWAPARLRRYFCYARIYTRRQLIALGEVTGFECRHSSYMFPPVDGFPLPKVIKTIYRNYSIRLERSSIAAFGVSIFVVLQKPAGVGNKTTEEE